MATPIPQNTAPFDIHELLEATRGEFISGRTEGSLRGVATDTREELASKIFVALKGERFDGHRYLAEAVQKGASALVVSERPSGGFGPDVSVVLVEDTLQALGDLAAFHRARWAGRLVAVVGSAGKTTTRSVITALLGAKYSNRVHSTTGNLNNRIGVPMVLLGLRSEHEFCSLEIGTNQPGEVGELSRIANPDVGVLTLIDLEHTEGLGDLDGVEREEGAIFPHLKPDGVAIGFGEDGRVLARLEASGRRTFSYGYDEQRDVRIIEQELIDDRRCRVTLLRGGEELVVRSPLIGRPGALAVAAGVSAVEALTGEALEAELCSTALARAGEPGRNQVVTLSEGRLVIDDTYNSNPASVENSIETGRQLAERSGGSLWLVLGEMLELGTLSESAHRQMGRSAAASGAAGVVFVQGDSRYSAEEVGVGLDINEFFDDADEVAPFLAPRVGPCDVVVVKASRGVRAERVVRGLQAFYKSAPTAASELPDQGSGSSS